MFPNGNNFSGIWSSDNYLFGTALFDLHRRYDGLPEEIRSYLIEHENEIRTEEDVDRLVREYDLKK